MSLQMYMRMDGITGESSSFQHKGWFDILSWNWGMTSNRKSAELTEGEKTAFNELSVIKFIGADSADVRLLYAVGKVLPAVDFSIRPVMGKRQAQVKYLDIRLEQVKIKSIVMGGSIDDKYFKEHITLLFDRVNFEYNKSSMHDSEGSESSPSAEFNFGWDIATGKQWKK